MKPEVYYLNQEQTIARFYPIKKNWKKKLTNIDFFHAPVFMQEGLIFKGKIDIGRFLAAMHHALQDFDFLFYQLCKSDGALYASYSSEEDNGPFIELEIENKEQSINHFALTAILPRNVDGRIRGIVTDKFNGLPMVAFKLTTFLDGFSIACYWNHALLDQASMVYFFKYLSHLYTYGVDNITLKKPNLVDMTALSMESPRIYENLADFRQHGEALLGFKYTPPEINDITSSKIEDSDRSLQLNSTLTAELDFNISEIYKLRDTAQQYLSANDIIHAILLKIYSFNSDLPSDSVFCFGFACNMRKFCGFGEEAIGNILSHPLMFLTLEDINNKSIIELALFNRQRLSEVNLALFKESLGWYKQLNLYHENPLQYVSALNLLNAKVTNWSTFNYSDILFDDAEPIELKTLDLAPFGVNVISFSKNANEVILKTSICLSQNCIDVLKKLERTTRLFSSKIKAKDQVIVSDASVVQSESIFTQTSLAFFQSAKQQAENRDPEPKSEGAILPQHAQF